MARLLYAFLALSFTLGAVQVQCLSNPKVGNSVQEVHGSDLHPIVLHTFHNRQKGSHAVSRQTADDFKITATIKEKPTTQPAKMLLILMSFVIKNEDVSQLISNAIIECVATETKTNVSNWGLFAAEKFAAGTFQVEYFALVHIERTLDFRSTITAYSKEKKLPLCVRSKIPSFKANADILTGRRATEAMPNEVKVVTGGIPAWVIGAIVGGLVLCAMASMILATVKKTRIFDQALFEKDHVYQPTPREERAREAAELENDLRAIAVGWQGESV